MRIRLIVMFVLVGALISVTAAGEEGITDTEIHIGQYGPLSGVAQAWGKTIWGPKLLFAYVNAQGGIHGRKLVLDYFDDSYNPAKTMHGVKDLQEHKGIFAWVGGVGTENGLRIKDYLMKRKIPWVGPFSGSSAWITPPHEYLFTIFPQSKYEGRLITRYVGNILKKKNIAIIYQDDGFGREALGGVKSELRKHPEMKLTAAIPVSKKERKLEPYVNNLRKSKPDIVLLWVNPFAAVKVLHISKLMHFEPVWMSPSPLSDYEYLYPKSRKLIEGLISVHYVTMDKSGIEPFRRFWEENKDQLDIPEFTEFLIGSLGYAEPLVAALKHCGRDLTREKFVHEMEKIKNYKGVIGSIAYGPFDPDNPDCRIGMKKIYMSQCLPDGKKRILTDWFDDQSEITERNPPML